MLVVLNLVAGFQALGTLMAVGLMMLPAITARLWAQRGGMLLTAITLALGSGWAACCARITLTCLLARRLFCLPAACIIVAAVRPGWRVLPRLIRQRHLAH